MGATEAIRIRRGRAIALDYDASGPCGRSFLAGGASRIDRVGFALLEAAAAWIEPSQVFAALEPVHDRAQLASALLTLIDAGMIVVEGTESAARDARYEAVWRWGALAGLFHFGIKDAVFADPAAAHAQIAHRVATAPRVPLWTDHAGEPDRIALAPPRFDGLLGAMRARRSSRGFDPAAAISRDALGDVLVSGFGVIGFFETATPGEGPLPLTMTPSGGARNPFEAYVLVARVDGLAPGVYHYSGVDHSLAPRGGLPASFAGLLGGQSWFEAAAAVIVLVAELPRTMWKYGHPNGYRVVLIEAGHIAQNLLLTAAAHGLAAAPTCAVSDLSLEELLGLDRVSQAPLYTVALGAPSGAPSVADIPEVVPNARLGLGAAICHSPTGCSPVPRPPRNEDVSVSAQQTGGARTDPTAPCRSCRGRRTARS